MACRLVEVKYDSKEGLVIHLLSPSLFPSEVRSHLLGAKRELLLALRGFLDAAISALEEGQPPEKPRRVEVTGPKKGE